MCAKWDPLPNIVRAWKRMLIRAYSVPDGYRPNGTTMRLVMNILTRACAGVEANLNGSKM